MRNKDSKYKRILKEISEILWNEWDPVGVNDVPEARDEYDSYLGTVYWLLAVKAPDAFLYSYLYYVESVLMGLPKPGSKIKKTISKLKEIDLKKE